eukprot:4211799-Karenia_brevis.AAC.1
MHMHAKHISLSVKRHERSVVPFYIHNTPGMMCLRPVWCVCTACTASSLEVAESIDPECTVPTKSQQDPQKLVRRPLVPQGPGL